MSTSPIVSSLRAGVEFYRAELDKERRLRAEQMARFIQLQSRLMQENADLRERLLRDVKDAA